MGVPTVTLISPTNGYSISTIVGALYAKYEDLVDGKIASSFKFEIDTVDTFDSGDLQSVTYSSVVSGSTKMAIFTLASDTWYWRVTGTNEDDTTVSTTYSLIVAMTQKRALYNYMNVAKYGPDWENKRALYQYMNVAKYGPDWENKRALYQYLNVSDDPPFPWIERLNRVNVYAGGSITIYGAGFGYGSEDDTSNSNRYLRQYGGKAYIGNNIVESIEWTWEEISILVPGDTPPGSYAIKVTLDKPTESGLRESNIIVINVLAATIGEDYFLEFKVFDRSALTAPIVILENAAGRSFQKQINGCGSGMLTFNRDDPKLVEVQVGRIIKCYYNATEVFAWVVENVFPQYVNKNMQTLVPVNGRGVLSLLNDAAVYPLGYPTHASLERSWTDIYAGIIIIQLLDEAHVRGTITDVTIDFTAVVDSAGIPWEEEVSFTIHTGVSLLSVITKLTDLGVVDVLMDSSLVLHVYNHRVSYNSVVLEPITGLLDHTRRIKGGEIKTVLFGEGANGELSVQENTEGINKYGRREGYLMVRDLSDINLVYYTNKILYAGSDVRWADQIEVDIYPFSPFVHYDVGDMVSLREPGVDGSSAGTQEHMDEDPTKPINLPVRVMSITMSSDDNGKIETTLDLNDYFISEEIKLQLWLENATKSSVSSTLGGDSSEPKAASDHTHDMVLSIKKTSEVAMIGAIEIAAGDNVSLTQDTENKKITIAASGGVGGPIFFKGSFTAKTGSNFICAFAEANTLSNGITVDNSLAKLTIVTAGKYIAFWQQLASASGSTYMECRKNGAVVAYSFGTTTYKEFNDSALIDCAVGDIIDFHYSGTITAAWSTPHSSVHVHKI